MAVTVYAPVRSNNGDIETWLMAQGWTPDLPVQDATENGGTQRIYSKGRQAILKRHAITEEYRQERDNLLLLHIIAPAHSPRLYARADGNLWLLMEDAGTYSYSSAVHNGEMVAAWRIVDAIATVHAASRAHAATLARPDLTRVDITTHITSAITRTRRSRLSGGDKKVLAATEQTLLRAMTNFAATGLRFSLGKPTANSVMLTGEPGEDSATPQRVVFTEQQHTPLGFPQDDLALFSEHPLRGEIINRYLSSRARLGDTVDATSFNRIYAYREIMTLAGQLGYHALTAFPIGASSSDPAVTEYIALEHYYLDAISTLAAPYTELQPFLTMLDSIFARSYAA